MDKDYDEEYQRVANESRAADPTVCLNCGCYGFCLGDGDYECRNCGNEWNIYEEVEGP